MLSTTCCFLISEIANDLRLAILYYVVIFIQDIFLKEDLFYRSTSYLVPPEGGGSARYLFAFLLTALLFKRPLQRPQASLLADFFEEEFRGQGQNRVSSFFRALQVNIRSR